VAITALEVLNRKQKLDPTDRKKILALLAEGLTTRVLASRFGVTLKTICQVRQEYLLGQDRRRVRRNRDD